MGNLFVPGQREWNVELLHEVFNVEDIDSILSLPVGSSIGIDKLQWHFDKRRVYFVQSGYKLEARRQLSLEEDLFILTWTKFWTLQLPRKFKIFLCKACRNFLK